jgi:hypothetical protein
MSIITTWDVSAHAEPSVEGFLEPAGVGTQHDLVGFETPFPQLPILNRDVRKDRRVRIPGYSLSVIDCVGLGLYSLSQSRLVFVKIIRLGRSLHGSVHRSTYVKNPYSRDW